MFNYVVLILTLHKFSLSFERTLFPPPSSIWERAENQPWGKIKNSYPFVFLCLHLCLTDIWIFLGHSTDAVWLKHRVTSTDLLVQCEPGPLISKIQSIKTHNIHSFLIWLKIKSLSYQLACQFARSDGKLEMGRRAPAWEYGDHLFPLQPTVHARAEVFSMSGTREMHIWVSPHLPFENLAVWQDENGLILISHLLYQELLENHLRVA